MIALLTGTLLAKGEDLLNDDAYCVVDVQGVGYHLLTSLSGLAHPSLVVGAPVTLYTRMVVRQDAILLVGFPSREERDLLGLLMTASGVGLKMGLAILSALSVSEIVQAIVSGNYAPLTEAKGVGKKGAQKIVLELKEKMTRFQRHAPMLAGLDASGVGVGAAVPQVPAYEEAEAVLFSLGYTPMEVVRSLDTVCRLPEVGPEAPSEVILKEALRWLAVSTR
jgi:Holliday junction DNA helicase RuvA